jgi:protein phosphatase
LSTVDDTDFSGPVWTHSEPRVAGATDVGAVRQVNQDAFARFDDVDRCEILLIVADGLGGHRSGEVASEMAVNRVGKLVFEIDEGPAERLRQSIEHANDAILKAGREDPSLDGMGTTIVCLLLAEDGRSYVAHVGDSRLYRLRRGRIKAITEDHSLVATLLREGVLSDDEAREDPRRNQILRALGVREDTEVDVAPVEIRPGDVYLLCSDGLHGMIDDTEILQIAHRPTRPEVVVDRLIEAANKAGGTDNITCLLAQVPRPMPLDGLRLTATRLIDSARNFFAPASNKPDSNR